MDSLQGSQWIVGAWVVQRRWVYQRERPQDSGSLGPWGRGYWIGVEGEESSSDQSTEEGGLWLQRHLWYIIVRALCKIRDCAYKTQVLYALVLVLYMYITRTDCNTTASTLVLCHSTIIMAKNTGPLAIYKEHGFGEQSFGKLAFVLRSCFACTNCSFLGPEFLALRVAINRGFFPSYHRTMLIITLKMSWYLLRTS